MQKYKQWLMEKWLKQLPEHKTGIFLNGKIYRASASEHLSKVGLKYNRLNRLTDRIKKKYKRILDEK